METKKNRKVILAAAAVLIIFVAAALILYGLFKPKAASGGKEITVTVVDDQGKKKSYELETDASYLGQALNEIEGLVVEGEEGDYGMYVRAVNGLEAVYERDQAYWAFYVNGEYCNYAIEEQPVYDKDAFEIKYEAGK